MEALLRGIILYRAIVDRFETTRRQITVSEFLTAIADHAMLINSYCLFFMMNFGIQF